MARGIILSLGAYRSKPSAKGEKWMGISCYSDYFGMNYV